MALYRQSSSGANGTSDYVSVGIQGGSRHLPYRRSKPPQANRISVGLFALTLSLIISIPALCYQILQSKGVETSRDQAQDDDVSTDPDLYKNVTRTKASKHPEFGNESFARDRVRRDENEALRNARDGSVENIRAIMKNLNRKSLFNKTRSFFNKRHKEAGHNELIMFEAKYKASLQNVRSSKDVVDDADDRNREVPADADEYDDGMDSRADVVEEVDDAVLEGRERAASTIPRDIDTWDSSHVDHVEDEKQDVVEEADNDASDAYTKETQTDPQNSSVVDNSKRARSVEAQPTRRSSPDKRRPVAKKKPKNQKPLGAACPMTILNSTALVVEPQENRKFASFMLEYAEKEQPLMGQENWEPRFGGHQTIREREESFLARDHEMKCGFVNGPDVLPGTGFNLDEDDRKYLSSCHIAVSSCIFGNSDRLRSPMGKTVSRLSKKNVCFVMFVDEVSLKTLSAEGHMPDTMGFIGLWKIVVVKDLPYSDMRRVGKIPKLLPHRIFPSARYSIWLDSKLRLTLDPLLILEYFLWRKGYEYAISNHYDRHCLWEEVAQNKRLNKYDHSIIDEQFKFYQSDGMRRFNEADPNKLLPSNVPEGSFIVRAHTPMSNLFSCLWFNEVDHFTPRDQLSFAYTYHKLIKMNPGKRFYLHMFKDCERRKIAKLYRHRSEEKKSNSHIDL